MSQKEFLEQFEKLCGVNKPIFLDTADTWQIRHDALVFAKDLKVEHAIGRQRLSFRNSAVCEIWIDVDNHDGIPFKELREKRLLPALQKLNSIGISNEFIFPKVSGTGFHLHVFVSDLPTNIDVSEFFQKTITETADVRSIVEKQMVREFGASPSTKNGFCGYISPAELLKVKALPTFKEPKYPDLKLFKCSPEFMLQLSLIKEDVEQTKMEHEPIVDFERDGDFMKLFKCPLITNLNEKAKNENHLFHNERVFLMTQFIHFGEPSRKKLHEIMAQCSDYDVNVTQKIIDHAMQNGYHPETCDRAKQLKLGCPSTCKGSGGKSPIKFAWTPLTLKELKRDYKDILLLAPEDDEVIDVLLAEIFDPHVQGDLAWLLLIAPPSCGKTVLLESIHDPKWSELIDLITDKTFISGKTYTDKETKEDLPIEGLLPKLNMRTLICKEFTTQLMQGEQMRRTIFGQLRAIYDCSYSQAFGSFDYSKTPDEWKHVRMGFIAGCTLYVDRYGTMNVILGERYLKLRLHETDRISAVKFAMMGTQKQKEKKVQLQRKTKRFLSNLTIPKEFDCPSEELGNAMAYLSEFIVQCRAPVEKQQLAVGQTVYEYEDRRELGTRFVQQIQRLGWMLTIVRGSPFDLNVYKTLFRVAMDTLPQNRKDMIMYAHKQKTPKTQTNILEDLRWGNYRTKNTLQELLLLGIFKLTANENYELSPYIRKCLNFALSPIVHSSIHSVQDGVITPSLLNVFNQLPTLPISASNYGKVHENKAQNGGGFRAGFRRHRHPCFPCEEIMCEPIHGCPAFRRWLKRGWW